MNAVNFIVRPIFKEVMLLSILSLRRWRKPKQVANISDNRKLLHATNVTTSLIVAMSPIALGFRRNSNYLSF